MIFIHNQNGELQSLTPMDFNIDTGILLPSINRSDSAWVFAPSRVHMSMILRLQLVISWHPFPYTYSVPRIE